MVSMATRRARPNKRDGEERQQISGARHGQIAPVIVVRVGEWEVASVGQQRGQHGPRHHRSDAARSCCVLAARELCGGGYGRVDGGWAHGPAGSELDGAGASGTEASEEERGGEQRHGQNQDDGGGSWRRGWMLGSMAAGATAV